jgi:hypothetical protein
MASKTRFHRGQTAWLRARLRLAGIKVDEELAQMIMSGRHVFPPSSAQDDMVQRLRDTAWNDRHDHSRTWEQAHPGRNPFPKSFPERVHEFAAEGLKIAYSEEGGDVSFYLQRIEEMARAELDEDNPFLPGSDNYRYPEDGASADE